MSTYIPQRTKSFGLGFNGRVSDYDLRNAVANNWPPSRHSHNVPPCRLDCLTSLFLSVCDGGASIKYVRSEGVTPTRLCSEGIYAAIGIGSKRRTGRGGQNAGNFAYVLNGSALGGAN